MAEGTQRRLAAILAADVVGYSRLMAADEAATLDQMRELRAELWDPKTEAHGGRLVGTAGDSRLVEFPSAVAAVQCAVAIQQAMVEHNADLAEDRQIRLRIGINLGDVVVDGDDICNRRSKNTPLRRPVCLAAGGEKIRHWIAFHRLDGRLEDVLSGALSEDQTCLSA